MVIDAETVIIVVIEHGVKMTESNAVTRSLHSLSQQYAEQFSECDLMLMQVTSHKLPPNFEIWVAVYVMSLGRLTHGHIGLLYIIQYDRPCLHSIALLYSFFRSVT